MFTAIKDKTYIERINMKKLLYLLCLLLITAPCFAGGVGYINYEKVAANYSFARNTMMEIQAKGREIDTFLRTKETEFNKINLNHICVPHENKFNIFTDIFVYFFGKFS